jgi:hypothetical protein
MSWLTNEEQQILQDVAKADRDLKSIQREVQESRKENADYYTSLSKRIDQIIAALQPPPNEPVAINVSEQAVESANLTGEKLMTPTPSTPIRKATVDFQILDDGKGVLFTLSPVNSAGNPVPLPAGTPAITATSSAPGSLTNAIDDPGDTTANPPRPPDTTGLVFLSTVPQPPVDATGITMTFATTLANGTTLTGVSTPVDVIADTSPVGFTITESVAS